MMALETIRALSSQAARTAARERKTPFVVNDPEVDLAHGFPFPFLGDYVPRGWHRRDEQFFVDASGWGAEDEPALTWRQFLDRLYGVEAEAVRADKTIGWAITEAGQFQVYVAIYEKTRTAKARTTKALLAPRRARRQP